MYSKPKKIQKKWSKSHNKFGVLQVFSKIRALLSLHTIHNKERHVILQRALPIIEFPKHLKEITIISQILPNGTHFIPTCEKTLCHNLKVIEQCKKKLSIISLLILHKMHQSRVRTFKGLLNCNMSLVFTFLSVTNHAKALTLDRTFDFHKKIG